MFSLDFVFFGTSLLFAGVELGRSGAGREGTGISFHEGGSQFDEFMDESPAAEGVAEMRRMEGIPSSPFVVCRGVRLVRFDGCCCVAVCVVNDVVDEEIDDAAG